MGKAILEILQRLYGSGFLQKIIGTRANVVKPQQFDINAPTKNVYSKDAFNDEKLIEKIDEQIIEKFSLTREIIVAIRNFRKEKKLRKNFLFCSHVLSRSFPNFSMVIVINLLPIASFMYKLCLPPPEPPPPPPFPSSAYPSLSSA